MAHIEIETKDTLLRIVSALSTLKSGTVGEIVEAAALRHRCAPMQLTNLQICTWLTEETSGGQMDLLAASPPKGGYAEVAENEISKRFK